MFIDNLRIDQFGQLRDAHANGMHRLTVLGCPNDSARASARDFIRWMLFGKEATTFANSHTSASHTSAPFDPLDHGNRLSARGSMSITRGGRRHQIQRADDSAYGRLTVDGRYDDSANEFRSLVSRVSLREFDAIFAPDFSRDIHPNELLDAIRTTDIDLTGRRIPNERLRQLQQRHHQLRTELDRFPHRDTLQQLTERRTFLLRRIDELNHHEQLRRRELDQQYNEVCTRIAQITSEVERLRSEYQLRNDEANRRRVELEEAWRVALEAKESFLRERREELIDLENRTDRWRSMLSEVRSRLAEVHEIRRRIPANGTHHDSSCLVSGLAEKLDRLRRDVSGWTEYQRGPYSAYPRDNETYVRPVIDDLRREVSQLCQTLQTRQGSGGNKERWLEHEADYLQHCESLMANWLSKLEEQLSVVRNALTHVESTGLTLVDGTYQPHVHPEYDARYVPPHSNPNRTYTTQHPSNQHPSNQYSGNPFPGDPISTGSLRGPDYRTNTYDAAPGYSHHYTQTFDTDGYYSGAAHAASVYSSPLYSSPVYSSSAYTGTPFTATPLHSDPLYAGHYATHYGTHSARPYSAGYLDWDGHYVRHTAHTENESYGHHYPRNATHYHTVQADSAIRSQSPIHHGFVEAVPHSCDGYDVIHPDADSLLRDLMDQRNRAQSDFEALQRELESLEAQRESVDERRRHVVDHEIQSVRQELNELEARFRDAEARERLEREIAHTVEQLSQARDDYRPSPVLDQASRILGQLTNGRFSHLRVHDGRQVAVDDGHGTLVNLTGSNLTPQLGERELRADAHLALCLALVTDYRRQGIDLPLIVAEPFVMATAGHDRTRAAVIRDFAAKGHQVIVTTSRPNHTHELFRGFDHVYVDLQPRPVVRPITPPLPRVTEPLPPVETPTPEPPAVVEPIVPKPEYEDQVRFKRRATSSHDTTNMPHSAHEPERPKSRFRRTDTPETLQPARQPSVRSHRSTTNEESSEFEPNETEPNETEPNETEAMGTKSVVRETTSRTSSNRERPSAIFSDEEHSLSLTSTIESTEVIEAEVAIWLRESGVETVREFLELMSSDLIQGMTDNGFTAYPVRRWQDELALRCWVVGLAATDAAMLVSCGIVDAEQLAEMDTDELYDFLVRSLKSQSGSQYDARRLESLRDRVHFWVRAARRSRTDWVRFRTRNYGKRNWSRSASSNRSHSTSSRSSRSNGNGSGNGSGRGNGNGNSNRSSTSSRRTSGSRTQSSRSSAATATATATETKSQTSTEKSLRFFLDSSDPLVDAPSIGARTAEHFHAIGAMTVGDFIKLNPKSAAAKIDNRRINAKTIELWQAQAILACRIPQIRGHDAQILVACEVTDPTTLARMDPDDLWARVKPFSKSSEGKRIIRSGKAPNLAEVRDWITWAKQSRTMRAA